MWVLLPSYKEKALAASVEKVKEMGYKVAVACVEGDELCNVKADKTFFTAERGKGAGMRYALERLREDVLIMDADLTYPLEKVPAFEEALEDYQVVWGDRYRHGRASQTWWKFLGNIFLSLTTSLLFLKPVYDLTNGMYALRRDALEVLLPCLTAKGFEIEADILTTTLAKGLSLTWVPITYKERPDAKITMQDGFRIFSFIFKKRLNPCPAKGGF